MNTDWESVAVILGLIFVAAFGCRWCVRSAARDLNKLLQRRPRRDLQAGEAAGWTGVEHTPLRVDAVSPSVLPRSSQTPAGAVDPRPAAFAGLQLPAGTNPPDAEARTPVVPAGTRRVTVHG